MFSPCVCLWSCILVIIRTYGVARNSLLAALSVAVNWSGMWGAPELASIAVAGSALGAACRHGVAYRFAHDL